MSQNSQKVAWQISAGHEWNSCIVFHDNSISAASEGASELDVQFDQVTCKRAPQFDLYAKEGKVPTLALLKADWWFECDYCGHNIMAHERDEDDNTPLDKVVVAGEFLYCNTDCSCKQQQRKDETDASFAEFKQTVQALRPDLTFTRFEGGWPYTTMTAEFTFAGSEHTAEIRDQDGDGHLEYLVACGDQDAWHHYQAGVDKA